MKSYYVIEQIDRVSFHYTIFYTYLEHTQPEFELYFHALIN